MKLLVEKNDTVTVCIYAYEKDNNIDAVNDEKEIPVDAKYQKLEFVFKKPSFSDSQALLKNAILPSSSTDGANFNMDVTALNEKIMKTMLTDWNIKNENGEDIPLNASNIGKLNPVIARSAASSFMNKIIL